MGTTIGSSWMGRSTGQQVNERSGKHDHESEYNVMLTTVLGFNLILGYSCHGDSEALGHTHAWVMFSDGCVVEWQRRLAVNLMLNMVGFKCTFPEKIVSASRASWAAKLKAPSSRWRVKEPEQQQTAKFMPPPQGAPPPGQELPGELPPRPQRAPPKPAGPTLRWQVKQPQQQAPPPMPQPTPEPSPPIQPLAEPSPEPQPQPQPQAPQPLAVSEGGFGFPDHPRRSKERTASPGE